MGTRLASDRPVRSAAKGAARLLWLCMAASLTALATGACGSTSRRPATSATGTQASSAHTAGAVSRAPESTRHPNLPPNFASIGVATQARQSNGEIATRYTCRGENVSPPVIWGGVPAGAKELIVVVRTLTRGAETTDWAVAGLAPARRQLRAGRLPAGAIVGRNSFGQAKYSLCPPAGTVSLVVIGLYAVPHKLALRPGFAQVQLAGVVGSPEVAWGSTTAYAGRK